MTESTARQLEELVYDNPLEHITSIFSKSQLEDGAVAIIILGNN